MPESAAATPLLSALQRLRDETSRLRLGLAVPGVEEMRRARQELIAQLDDYVLPRLRALDAPLLAVVGGSTGAGKSTLVNSVLGRQVTQPGVLRPTTRAPVLVHAPQDAQWFTDTRILPGLARTTAAGGDTRSLQLVADDSLAPGLAVLDAPDIDSVVSSNRELAGELLAAADLWLFVTTAARYADAVPWELLRQAGARSTALAMVLDRVPPDAMDEVSAHLGQMLHAKGLGDAPLFVIPETPPQAGLLPPEVVAPVRTWLHGLAADSSARAAIVRRTLDGVLDSLPGRVADLVAAAEQQQRTVGALGAAAEEAYARAGGAVDAAMRDGSLLRGEVLARWQEFIGTGELLRALESRIGRWRDQLKAAVLGRPQPEQELEIALETGVQALLRAESDRAAEAADAAWRAEPAGRALLDSSGGRLDRSSPDFTARAERLVRDWQGAVLALVRQEGQAKRSSARLLSYGVNAAGLLVMVAVFAHTGGLTGGEVAVAGGTSVLSQKLLEALLGDQAVRDLAARARADLRTRVDELFAEEQARYTSLLQREGDEGTAPQILVQTMRAVGSAR